MGFKDPTNDKGDSSSGSISNESASEEEDPEDETVSHDQIDSEGLQEGTDADDDEFAEWPWLQAVCA